MLMNTGTVAETSGHGLITTRAAQGPGPAQYATEGSVFIGGAVVQWLRDGLRAITASGEVGKLAQSVPDNGGVMFVPAFTGLGAPYWKPDARGTIVGLSRGSTLGHIARAALESIAFQSAALLEAMGKDAVAAGAAPVAELRVDGGASANDLLMQFQADLLGIPVLRPKVLETTALGAAYLAGLSCGVYSGTKELAAQWRIERTFHADAVAPARRRADAAVGARGAAGHGVSHRAEQPAIDRQARASSAFLSAPAPDWLGGSGDSVAGSAASVNDRFTGSRSRLASRSSSAGLERADLLDHAVDERIEGLDRMANAGRFRLAATAACRSRFDSVGFLSQIHGTSPVVERPWLRLAAGRRP